MKRLWQSIAKILMFAFALHFHAEFAFATSSPQGLHLQGRIVKSDGQPVEATNVDFTVQILSPGAEACVLFEETHTLNMLASDGMFNIRIGSGSRGGGNYEDTSTLAQVFDNSLPQINSLTCDNGDTDWDPGPQDARKLRITFNDGSGVGPQTLTQDQVIQAVPYALNADRVGGKVAGDFVQAITALEVTPGTTQTRFEQIFNTDYTGLQALLAGTSTLYAKANPTAAVSNNGQRFTNVADPTAAQDAATKNYSDTKIGGNTASLGILVAGDANKVVMWNGTQFVAQAIPSDATKLSLSGGTMTGAINMGGQNITAAGHVQLSNQATLLLGRYDNAQEATLVGGLAAADKGRTWFNTDTNKVRYWNGAAASDVGAGTVTSVSGTAPIQVATGTTTPVISIDDATGSAKGAVQVGTGLNVASGVVSVAFGDVDNTAVEADSIPNCTAAQKLSRSLGPTFTWSCVADVDTGLTSESDPSVSAFAKAALPTCGAGQVLSGNGTSLSCVADNATDSTKVAKAGDTMTGTLNLPADGLVAGTNQLVLSGGNVGIGTASPTSALQINGTQILTENANDAWGRHIKFQKDRAGAIVQDGDELGSVQFQGYNGSYVPGAMISSKVSGTPTGANLPAYLAFSTRLTGSTLERMRIDPSGNIGIGTTNPSYNLHVDGTDIDTKIMVRNKSSTADRFPGMQLENYLGTTNGFPTLTFSNYGGTSAATTVTPASKIVGGVVFKAYGTAQSEKVAEIDSYTGSNYSAGDLEGILSFRTRDAADASPTERMRIDQTGNVGIGITNPDTKLQVAGTIRVGDGGETCAGGNFTGGIRYNSGSLQYCNGTSWQSLGTSSATGDFMASGAVPMTGTLEGKDGTAASPSFAFDSEPTTGMYRNGAGDIGFSIGGSLGFRILGASGAYMSAGRLRMENGAVGTPAYGFQNDNDIGMYTTVPDTLQFSVGNSEGFRMHPNGVRLIPKALPGTPANGDIAIDSGDGNKLKYYNGSWHTLSDDTGITQLTGDVTAGAGSGAQAATIANDAVTFAKMQNINTARILGRTTASAGDVEEISAGAGITLSGGSLSVTFGDVDNTAVEADSIPNCTAAEKLQRSLGPTFTWSCVSDQSTDSSKVAKAGDTMTGTLNLPSNGLVVGTTELAVSGSKVGIGTASPQEKLHVDGGAGLGNLRLTNNFTGANAGDGANIGVNNSGELSFWHFENKPIVFATNGTERARLDAAGNLGIGTTSPGSSLSVSNNAAIGASYATVAAPTDSLIVSGNVGIGNSAPYSKLLVQDSLGLSNLTTVATGADKPVINALGATTATADTDTDHVSIKLQKVRVGQDAQAHISVTNEDTSSTAGSLLQFWVRPNNSSGYVSPLAVRNSGVGVGTTAPSTTFSVAGSSTLGTELASGSFTTLNAALGSADTVVTVVSTANYPSTGLLHINSEILSYSGKTATTFTGLTRGLYTTTVPASSASGTTVKGLAANFLPTTATQYSAAMSVYSNAAVVIGTQESSASLGGRSLTIGYNSRASGNYSFAQGDASRATGAQSFASGGVVTAAGTYSQAFGYSTTADSYGQATFGAYNLPKGGETAGSWVATDPLFVIGNGTGSGASRSTAMMVLKNGSVGIGTTSPNQLLTVEGVTSLRETTAPTATANYGKLYVKSSDSKLYFMNAAGTETELGSGGGGGGALTGVTSVANASGSISLEPQASTGSVTINSGTASVGTASGALVVTGGVGVSGALNVGGNMSAAGLALTGDLTSSGSIQMGEDSVPRYIGFGASWNNTISGSSVSNFLKFRTAGVEAMRIDSDGNVGMGTTAPVRKLHVVGLSRVSSSDGAKLELVRDDSTTIADDLLGEVRFGTTDGSNYSGLITGYASEARSAAAGGAYLTLNSVPNGTTTPAERLRIGQDGNVGIGITNPSAKLSIYSTSAQDAFSVRANNGATAVIDQYGGLTMTGASITSERFFGNGSGGATYPEFTLSDGSSGVGMFAPSSTTLGLSTNSTERLRIDASGNVGIGITNPSAKLDVNGVIKATSIQLTSGATNGYVLTSDGSGNATWTQPGTTVQFPQGVPTALPGAGNLQLFGLFNYIPNMTSATAPSGQASSSTSYVTAPAWNAFANNVNGWISDGSALPQWLQYKFDSAQVINSYEITPWSADNFPARSPATWKLQGSNDGSAWTDLHSQTGFSAWTLNTPQAFSFNNTTAYLYYRLYITANGGNAYAAVRRLTLLGGTGPSANGTAPVLFLRDPASNVYSAASDINPVSVNQPWNVSGSNVSYTTGNVGIGTTTPGVSLDVNGGVRAGSSTAVSTCGSGQANGEGTQRYNYTTHSMEYCNGTTWVALASTASQGQAAAWVNFNGNGGATVRSSYNVSSVTRNSTGNYTITFNTAMADANYSVVVTPSGDATAASLGYEANSGNNRSNASTTSVTIQITNVSGGAVDRASINVVVYR